MKKQFLTAFLFIFAVSMISSGLARAAETPADTAAVVKQDIHKHGAHAHHAAHAHANKVKKAAKKS